MPFQPLTENEAYAGMLCEHVERLVGRLGEFPPDWWEWAPTPSAPTARILAAHALQWLQSDRQHIVEPDASQHPRIPDPPSDPQAMCDALQEEAARWRRLILSLTPEQLSEPRFLFCHDDPLNVRALVCHMVKNVTYKHGQLATLYFALGLDGSDPYKSPLPNPEYEACLGSTPDEIRSVAVDARTMRTLHVRIEVPGDASRESIELAESKAQEAAVLALQQAGELTFREAAAALQLTYEGYLELLAERGLPATHDTTTPEVLELLRRSLRESR